MNRTGLAFIIIFSGLSILLFGQSDTTMVMLPIQADRPDQTETPHLVPKGYAQMELGFSIVDTDPGFIYSYPSALWKYGVTNNFELRLITQYVTIQNEPNPDQNGILPLAFGLKAKLSEQKGIWPKMSLIGHLRVPGVVSEDFETEYLAPDLRLAFQHTVSDFFSIGYNVGLLWDGNNAEPVIIYTFSTGLGITNRLGLFGEVYGETYQRDNEDPQLYVDAGLTYLIGNDFLLDVSASTGITEMAPLSYISAGFSYRFNLCGN